MMLTGLPLDNTKVLEVEKELTEKHDIHVKKISEYPEILKFNWAFRHKTMVEVIKMVKLNKYELDISITLKEGEIIYFKIE